MIPALTTLRKAHRFAAALLAALSILGACPVHAGPFVVQPTRLELAASRPSGALVVRNEGLSILAFQVTGMRWTEDHEGREHYTDTDDLIYFPRRLTLPPGQSAVIRVGLRQPAGALEKTYRLFIEQLAMPGPPDDGPQPRIHVLMRLGAPVFVASLAPRQQLALPAFTVDQGQVHWTLINEGSRHEVFQAIALRGLDATGTEVFRQEFNGRYFLAGALRRFRADLPADTCPRIDHLVLEVRTEHSRISRQLQPGASACAPQVAPADSRG
ncbi:MAG: sigma-fimbria biosis chaperone protein [Pseudomonadota bacterium]|jgi:fimbrial chaperone protein